MHHQLPKQFFQNGMGIRLCTVMTIGRTAHNAWLAPHITRLLPCLWQR
jgi:hypothetical protein